MPDSDTHDPPRPVDGGGGPATAELSVSGMHCGACAVRVERKLAKVPGVASAAVNLATATAFVAYHPAACRETDLCGAVEAAGYAATPVAAEPVRVAAADRVHWGRRALVAWPLALAAAAVAVLGPENATAGWWVVALAAVAVLGCGAPFVLGALRLARHGALSMDSLIALGTTSALAVSVLEAAVFDGRHVHLGGGGTIAAALHGVMAPVIIAVLATGRWVETRARDRAGSAMHALLGLRPPVARLLAGPDDERGELVAPESVPVGALVRVGNAEPVPLDGVVVAGTSTVDESMLTGEAFPADRGPGQAVVGGTRNGDGVLVVRVTAVAQESVLARLQRMVEDAQRDKARLQRLADRVSAVFVPVVLAVAALAFLGRWWLAGDAGAGLLSAVAVMLVACPCAMGLAAPIATMVGLGRASELGILVRSGDALERLAAVDLAVFDKTGTLTARTAVVAGVVAAPGCTGTRVLELAAAVEADADHPIARAITARVDVPRHGRRRGRAGGLRGAAHPVLIKDSRPGPDRVDRAEHREHHQHGRAASRHPPDGHHPSQAAAPEDHQGRHDPQPEEGTDPDRDRVGIARREGGDDDLGRVGELREHRDAETRRDHTPGRPRRLDRHLVVVIVFALPDQHHGGDDEDHREAAGQCPLREQREQAARDDRDDDVHQHAGADTQEHQPSGEPAREHEGRQPARVRHLREEGEPERDEGHGHEPSLLRPPPDHNRGLAALRLAACPRLTADA